MDSHTSGQVRISRPTNQLDEVVRFYHDGLGMQEILRFEKDPWGYGGVVLAKQGFNIHLEFTTHENGFPEKMINSPSHDHLLVFYLIDKIIYDQLVFHLKEQGYQPVAAGNPHWDKEGVTFIDPDGWRVVLMNKTNI
jgi:catechol 2,3-dioxygenase-like lactoylglutathione lyase family enzyme